MDVNTIKHNSDQLYQSDDSLFHPAAGTRSDRNFEDPLTADEALVDRLFDVVRSSGPAVDSKVNLRPV